MLQLFRSPITNSLSWNNRMSQYYAVNYQNPNHELLTTQSLTAGKSSRLLMKIIPSIPSGFFRSCFNSIDYQLWPNPGGVDSFTIPLPIPFTGRLRILEAEFEDSLNLIGSITTNECSNYVVSSGTSPDSYVKTQEVAPPTCSNKPCPTAEQFPRVCQGTGLQKPIVRTGSVSVFTCQNSIHCRSFPGFSS